MAKAVVTVYRFRRVDDGETRSPRHMWGTLQAIGRLHRCEPIADTARQVPADEVDAEGFFYDTPDTPGVKIDD